MARNFIQTGFKNISKNEYRDLLIFFGFTYQRIFFKNKINLSSAIKILFSNSIYVFLEQPSI